MPPEDLTGVVERFLEGCRQPGDRRRILAFYGGSFTGIDRPLFERYLAEASRLKETGVVHGIKASTRPDLVTGENVERCRQAGFVEMEIGAQSMDDEVLLSCRRGHTAADTVRAAQTIRNSGLGLVVQIMPGLPGEDRSSFRRTVDEISLLKPDGVRIYPAVVLEGTTLERLYEAGSYLPLDLEEAVRRTLYAYVRLTREGCHVLRMGLPPSKDLRIAAGPYHPSFGFLVKAKAFRVMAGLLLERCGSPLDLEVHPDDVSELLGHRGENLRELCFSYSFNAKMPRGYVQVRGAAERGCLQPKDIIEYIL